MLLVNHTVNMWDSTGHVPDWVGQEEHIIYMSDNQTTKVSTVASRTGIKAIKKYF
jgi:hypothetical protein